MPATTLQELFVEELRDMYDGEKRLIKALPKLARAASNEELQMAFTSHLEETKKQATRLEQVFRAIGEKPRGKKCDGIMGIVEEGNTAMQELDEGPVLDAALIAGAQKAEHYEIASYGTLAYFAECLGNERAKNLLGETLEEEKAADKKLNTIAKARVNRQALAGAGMEDEDSGEVFSMPQSMRRMASSMGIANDTSDSSSRGSASSRRSSKSSRSRGSRSRSSSRSRRSR